MKEVLVPLIFFAQFNRPLTLKQIRRYAWGKEFGMDELKRILKRAAVKQSGEFYYLEESQVQNALEREQRAEKFWKYVKRFLWIFANVPFLKMAAVQNSLAYGSVGKKSDIDLLIVTRKNRIWTARAFLLLWLSLFNLRTTSKRKYMKFSPEILIDEAALNLGSYVVSNDYLIHYQMADTVPIWNVPFWKTFLSANCWIKAKLPVAYRSSNIREEFGNTASASWFAWLMERMLSGKFGDRVEAWAKIQQKKKLERARERLGITPNVVLGDHMIQTHFHGKWGEFREIIEEALAKYS